MGQQCTALMLGIKPNEELSEKLTNEDGEDLWAEPGKGKKVLSFEDSPDWHENARDALGFSFACSVPEDEEGDLGEVSVEVGDINKVREAFPEPFKKAEQKWKKFATWMKKEHGLELPEPTIFVTTVERA